MSSLVFSAEAPRIPERKNYPHLKHPVGPYVHAVKYNGLLFLSGLTAFGSSAQGGSIAEQVHAIFAQMATIAAAEDSSLAALLKVTLFVTRFDDQKALREALFDNYGAALPASSLVKVSALYAPDIDVEIEAVLAVG
jgi:2-iminobutanoate/2-iminopropanoate deaminase